MPKDFSRPKVARDIKECIETLEKEPQDFTAVIGILRRCAFEVEGVENIWTDGMSNYQKVVTAIERGFDIREVYPDGILILYLGYHLYEFTDTEIKALKALAESRKESNERQNDSQ